MKFQFLIFLKMIGISVGYLTSYFEELCDLNVARIYVPSSGDLSSGTLQPNRDGVYSSSRNCSLKITSTFGVIVSVTKINFRPGCNDYLKIYDGVRHVALCGYKTENDKNMQFSGKSIQLNYVTEDMGLNTQNTVGFILDYTGYEQQPCNKWTSFECSNGYCIYEGFVNDGRNNCGDFSDEKVYKGRVLSIVVVIALIFLSLLGVATGISVSAIVMAILTDVWIACRSGASTLRNPRLCCTREGATADLLLSCC